jgi:hypothetical protein
MLGSPRDLADRLSDKRETFTLPLDAARTKARQILRQQPVDGYTTVVESWRQLPCGKIEFTTLQMQAAD